MLFLTAPALNLWPWVLLLLGLGCLALAVLRTWNFLQYRKRRRSKRAQKLDVITIGLYATAALVFLCAIFVKNEITVPPPRTIPNLHPAKA